MDKDYLRQRWDRKNHYRQEKKVKFFKKEKGKQSPSNDYSRSNKWEDDTTETKGDYNVNLQDD